MSLEYFGAVRPLVWLKTIRAPFMTASLVPVMVGTALAWYVEGHFNMALFGMTMLGMALLHAGSNLLNDYCDHRSGCDEINDSPSPYNGGSRSIQEGLIPAHTVLSAGIILLILGCGAGLILFYQTPGPTVLWLGIAGVVLGYSYTGHPFRLAYRGLGEITVGFAFGLLPVLGSYFVQTGHMHDLILWAGLPISFLIILVLFVNQFPDYYADKAVGKRNIVVRLGRRKAAGIVPILIALPYLIVVSAVMQEKLPTTALLTCASAPMGTAIWKRVSRKRERPGQFIPAMENAVKLHLVFGLVFCASLIMARWN